MKINVNTDKNNVLLGELINFTIEIYNDEQYKLENLEFNISPCIEAVLIPRSILVNNKSTNNSSYNKVTLGDLNPNEKLTINYVEKIEALTIENKVIFKAKFKFLCNGKLVEQNLVLKEVNINVLKLRIDNFEDIIEGALNQEINLQFMLKNIGSISLRELQIENFWNKFSNFLKLKCIYVNDKRYDYSKINNVILKELDVQEFCVMKMIFTVKKVPEKLISMIPKIKVKYRREELLYEQKLIEGNIVYINVHSNFLKNVEKTFIINHDARSVENIFYKIKVNDTKLDKFIVKENGRDSERLILKVILSVIFKTDLYRECDKEILEFNVVLPKKYNFVRKENIYVGIIKDLIEINDANSLILKLKCNIYNNNLLENKTIHSV